MRHGFDPRVAHRLLALFGVSASGREQAQEVRFARPVRAEYCDPITEKRVEIERTHQTRQLQRLAGHNALPGPPTVQPHLKALLARLPLRRPGLLEPGQPSLRCPITGSHVGVVSGLLLVHEHERAQLRVLFAPAAAQLVQPLEPLLPRTVVRVEPARMRLRSVARNAEFQCNDRGRRLGQQLTVVTHV